MTHQSLYSSNPIYRTNLYQIHLERSRLESLQHHLLLRIMHLLHTRLFLSVGKRHRMITTPSSKTRSQQTTRTFYIFCIPFHFWIPSPQSKIFWEILWRHLHKTHRALLIDDLASRSDISKPETTLHYWQKSRTTTHLWQHFTWQKRQLLSLVDFQVIITFPSRCLQQPIANRNFGQLFLDLLYLTIIYHLSIETPLQILAVLQVLETFSGNLQLASTIIHRPT